MTPNHTTRYVEHDGDTTTVTSGQGQREDAEERRGRALQKGLYVGLLAFLIAPLAALPALAGAVRGRYSARR